jgi:Spy/CpxP family protein refolding chaperone
MTSDTKWISILSALMLLTGILLGVAMDRLLFNPAPPPYVPPWTMGRWMSPRAGERALGRMSSRLGLNDDQKSKMREIFRRYRPRLRQTFIEGGDFAAVRREMRAEIAKVLTPEQLQKFDEMNRRSEQWRMHMHTQAPNAPSAPPAPPPPK